MKRVRSFSESHPPAQPSLPHAVSEGEESAPQRITGDGLIALFRSSWLAPIMNFTEMQVITAPTLNKLASEGWNAFEVKLLWKGQELTLRVRQTSAKDGTDPDELNPIRVDPPSAVINLAPGQLKKYNFPGNTRFVSELKWHSVNNIVETHGGTTYKVRQRSAKLLKSTMAELVTLLCDQFDSAIRLSAAQFDLTVVCLHGIERSLFFFNLLAFVFMALRKRDLGAASRSEFVQHLVADAPSKVGRIARKQKVETQTGRPDLMALFKVVRERLADRLDIDVSDA